jgi:predicted transcriptional regulator
MPTSKANVRTSVLLPEQDYARLQTMAETNHVSTAWVIRAAILRFLEEHDSKQTELPLRLTRQQRVSRS